MSVTGVCTTTRKLLKIKIGLHNPSWARYKICGLSPSFHCENRSGEDWTGKREQESIVHYCGPTFLYMYHSTAIAHVLHTSHRELLHLMMNRSNQTWARFSNVSAPVRLDADKENRLPLN